MLLGCKTTNKQVIAMEFEGGLVVEILYEIFSAKHAAK